MREHETLGGGGDAPRGPGEDLVQLPGRGRSHDRSGSPPVMSATPSPARRRPWSHRAPRGRAQRSPRPRAGWSRRAPCRSRAPPRRARVGALIASIASRAWLHRALLAGPVSARASSLSSAATVGLGDRDPAAPRRGSARRRSGRPAPGRSPRPAAGRGPPSRRRLHAPRRGATRSARHPRRRRAGALPPVHGRERAAPPGCRCRRPRERSDGRRSSGGPGSSTAASASASAAAAASSAVAARPASAARSSGAPSPSRAAADASSAAGGASLRDSSEDRPRDGLSAQRSRLAGGGPPGGRQRRDELADVERITAGRGGAGRAELVVGAVELEPDEARDRGVAQRLQRARRSVRSCPAIWAVNRP